MGKEREREKEQLELKVTHTVWTHLISRMVQTHFELYV